MSTRALSISSSTIGKKYVMAVTGFLLFGFLIVHMLGNLQLFLGPETFNDYSKSIRELPVPVLWGFRVTMALAATLHVLFSLQLWWLNRSARPSRYKRTYRVATTFAARTMIFTGPIILLYVVYHVAHLTFGVTEYLSYAHSPVMIYDNVVRSFQVLPLAIGYAVAGCAIGLHLYHGSWSMLQTLGINHPRYTDLGRSIAVAVGLAVALGFVAVPTGVQLEHHNVVKVLPTGG